MLEQAITREIHSFTPAGRRDQRLQMIGGQTLGVSEAGRPLVGIELGVGPRRATLLAGAHADEPVGPETLMYFAEWLAGESEEARKLRKGWRFRIVPHVNPDGEASNSQWIDAWPDPLACLRHRRREPPGRDVEFAYPDGRAENEAAADFMRPAAPIALHVSLHGMTAATGAWHLIDRDSIERTAELRARYAEAVVEAGLGLLDWDRGGEKGFEYIAAGFSTTPTGQAMRKHFKAAGDSATAGKFRDSSMELAGKLSADASLEGAAGPLCMVTELPLWLVRSDRVEDEPRDPKAFFAFGEAVDAAREALARNDTDAALAAVGDFELEPVPIHTACRLQLRAIELGLSAA